MKVKDLIALLQEYNEDAEVVLQGDDEGNYYKLVRGVEEDSYFGENGVDHEPIFLSQYANLEHMAMYTHFDGEEIEDFIESLKDVVAIY